MINKESIVLSIRVNNYEIEIFNKYKDEINLKYQENKKHLDHIWGKISSLEYTSKYGVNPINPPLDVNLTILSIMEDTNTTDLNINVKTSHDQVKYNNQARSQLPYVINQAERWKPVLQVFEERLKFIQSRLDDLKKQNINLKRALLDLEEGKSIQEVESILLKSQQNENNKNDKKLEYDSKLKELGYENLEKLCDAIAEKLGLVKHEKISEDDIKKVYDEITKLGIETTLGSVTTTLRKKCEFSKPRKTKSPEVK